VKIRPGSKIYYFNFEKFIFPNKVGNMIPWYGMKGIFEVVHQSYWTDAFIHKDWIDVYNCKFGSWEISYPPEIINFLIETGKIKELTEDDLMIKDIIE